MFPPAALYFLKKQHFHQVSQIISFKRISSASVSVPVPVSVSVSGRGGGVSWDPQV